VGGQSTSEEEGVHLPLQVVPYDFGAGGKARRRYSHAVIQEGKIEKKRGEKEIKNLKWKNKKEKI
jgi:hypothetical protein